MSSPNDPHSDSIDPTIDLARTSAAESAKETTDALKPVDNAGEKNASVRVRYFGEYELLDEIARGGMGIVFKARQIKLKRIVALKMILSGTWASVEDIERFKIEAEAAANLDHPGIVPIYEIGTHEGQHYFSMAFVEGRSLAHTIQDGPLPPRQAAGIVKKVAEAVAYAHGKGVIHRDLKPANVLIDCRGEPKVTDFGLAKQVKSDRDLTRTGAVIGTPSYMSPEQAGGHVEKVGPQSDVYSLGAILYCLLTGRPPFQSAYPIDILRQVLEKEAVPPQALNMGISKDLDTICLKCLHKDANRRYQTAQELADELQRFLLGEPIHARPVSKPEGAWRWAKRNPVIAGAMLAVMTSIVVTLIGLTVAFTREAHQRRRSERALSVLRLQEVARIVAHSPDDARELLQKIPQDQRDLMWNLLWRSAESYHRRILFHDDENRVVKESIDEFWLSPHGNLIVCSDLTNLWLISPHSILATRRKILDTRQYSELLKTQLGRDLDQELLPLRMYFESEHVFTLRPDEETEHVLSYSVSQNLWSVKPLGTARESPAIDIGIDSTASVDLGDVSMIDGQLSRAVLTASFDDGRIVECRAPTTAINSKRSKRQDGTEREVFVSSEGPHTIFLRGARSSNVGQETDQSFPAPGLTRLNRSSRLTVCRGKNQILIHDSKSVFRFDFDKSELHRLDASVRGSVWRAAVSRDGTRIGFIHHLPRAADIKRVRISILDENGTTVFSSSFHSSHIQSDALVDAEKPYQAVTFTSFLTDLDFPNPQFSADTRTFAVVENRPDDQPPVVHVLSLGQEGLGPAWKPHSHRILAAAHIPQSDEITTVDETGAVRNWKDRTLLSEWRIPEVDQATSIIIRGNSLICLNWEKGDPDPSHRPNSVSRWTYRRAVVRGRVFSRRSGQVWLELPRIEILDESGVPKSAIALTARDIALLPELSDDGLRLLRLAKVADKFTISCIDLERNQILLEREIPQPLRIGFGTDSDQVLVFRSDEPRRFAVTVFDVANPEHQQEVHLDIPEDVEKWQGEVTSLTGRQYRGKSLTEFENLWPMAAFAAYHSGLRTNPSWEPFFNWSGRSLLSDLRRVPLVLHRRDGSYLDFRHRTNAIRLRAKDGTIIREMVMTTPLSGIWSTVVDRDRTLLTMGPDLIMQLRELPSGEEAGALPIPFKELDGLFESPDAARILMWGDQGRLVVYDTNRN